MRPLPFEDPERLVMVRGRWPVRNVDKAGLSPGDLADFIHDTTAFEEFAALVLFSVSVADGDGEPEQLRIASVTPNFFSLLGIETSLGHGFAPDDGNDTVVISHGLWHRRFGGDPAVLGQPLRIRGNSNTIVGVLPSGLTIHVPEQTGAPAIDTDVWKVQNWDLDPSSANRQAYFLRVYARLEPGATLAQAQQEADMVAREHRRLYDDAARVNTPDMRKNPFFAIFRALSPLFSRPGFAKHRFFLTSSVQTQLKKLVRDHFVLDSFSEAI